MIRGGAMHGRVIRRGGRVCGTLEKSGEVGRLNLGGKLFSLCAGDLPCAVIT